MAPGVASQSSGDQSSETRFGRASPAAYAGVGILTLLVLAYGVIEQLYDTNFYVLWETTALRAGDHPYRDFFQWGSPLLTAVSTAAQVATGTRLVGEFAIHWLFIAAGMVVGFHLAWRLSRSQPWALAVTALGILVLVSTPTFQFPKIFFYPVAVWVGWWYLERPGVRRAAMLGLVTAAAFLYRHDHGVYIGVAAVLAFVLARVAHPHARDPRASLREIVVYAGIAAAVIAPWALVVEWNEGLLDYVRMRAAWNRTWAPEPHPYVQLVGLDPLWWLAPRPPGERLVPHGPAVHWLLQVTLLLPVLLCGSSAIDAWRAVRRGQRVTLETCEVLLAAGLAATVGSFLFREDGYFVVVLPLTVAFGARLLAGASRDARERRWSPWAWTRVCVSWLALAITGLGVVGNLDWDQFSRSELDELTPTYRQLFTTPPIDAYESTDEAVRLTLDWAAAGQDDRARAAIRYMHDCTRETDRLLVTGSTPYHVGYYTNRRMAGGHVQWHHAWRSDPVHERQSLGLIEQSRVPFVFSTHDRVLDDFARYPAIRMYLERHYVEVPGADGRLLVDRRLTPTRTFGGLAWPCFR